MAKGPKGDRSAPPTLGKDESWENIDEGWEGLENEARRERKELTGLPTLELDRAARGATPDSDRVTPVTERAKTEPDHRAVGPLDDRTTPALEHLPPEQDPSRQLPVAPPGHRRVSKTIMGLGAPDLQSLLKAEQVVRGGPARRLESSSDEVQIYTTPPPEEVATLRSPPPEEMATVRQQKQAPIEEAATEVASPPRPSPFSSIHTEVTPAGRTNPLPAVESTDLLPSTSTTIPDPTPPSDTGVETHAKQAPTVPTVRPGPVARPPTASRYRPPETSRVDHGPSNLTLAILWMVALASVGLAIFLYATR